MSIVPPNGLILVTGANGYLSTGLIKTLLANGYRVRGTVRSVAKHSWLLSHFGPNLTLVEVSDASAENAFSEAIKGVDGVAHIATSTSLSPDLALMDEIVKGVLNVLEASAQESSVKRLVLTSSARACGFQIPGRPYKMDTNSFNYEALEAVKKPWDGKNPEPIFWGQMIYSASKALSELKAWEWVRENKPHFVFNTVCPDATMGPVVAPEKVGLPSTAGFIGSMVRGDPLASKMAPAEWYVNNEDVALLHMGALILEEVQNERLLGFAGKYTWMEILAIVSKHFPKQKGSFAVVEETYKDEGEVDNSRAIEVLRMLGRDGFRSLEDTVVQNMEAVIAEEMSAGNGNPAQLRWRN